MKQSRYFIAVDVSGQVKRAVEEAQSKLVKDQPGLMHPLQPHVTLLNPSMLSGVPPMYLLPKIRELTPKYLPLVIKFKQVLTFSQRVVYVSVDCPALLELRQKLIDLLPEGVQSAHTVGREFTPHVTVAQAKPKQKLPSGLIDNLASALQPVLPATQTSEHLTKFTWQKPRTYRKELIS